MPSDTVDDDGTVTTDPHRISYRCVVYPFYKVENNIYDIFIIRYRFIILIYICIKTQHWFGVAHKMFKQRFCIILPICVIAIDQ